MLDKIVIANRGEIAVRVASTLRRLGIASAAVVQRAGSATFHAAVTVPPGNQHVLRLELDRPHPVVPRSPAGLEPWLLQRPAAPEILLADVA